MTIVYKRPSKLVFNDIKTNCINQWKKFDNKYGYVTEKLERVQQIKNNEADVIFLLNMFHPVTRNVIISQLKEESKNYIKYYDSINIKG